MSELENQLRALLEHKVRIAEESYDLTKDLDPRVISEIYRLYCQLQATQKNLKCDTEGTPYKIGLFSALLQWQEMKQKRYVEMTGKENPIIAAEIKRLQSQLENLKDNTSESESSTENEFQFPTLPESIESLK